VSGCRPSGPCVVLFIHLLHTERVVWVNTKEVSNNEAETTSYLCGVPDSAGQWYQPNDHLLYLGSEVEFITEVARRSRLEHVVQQLSIW